MHTPQLARAEHRCGNGQYAGTGTLCLNGFSRVVGPPSSSTNPSTDDTHNQSCDYAGQQGGGKKEQVDDHAPQHHLEDRRGHIAGVRWSTYVGDEHLDRHDQSYEPCDSGPDHSAGSRRRTETFRP